MKQLFLTLTLLYIIFPSAVTSETRVFTNQDLEKYKNPSDNKTSETKNDRLDYLIEKTKKAEDRVNREIENIDKDFWCNWGSYYQKQVDIAKRKKEDIEKKIRDANMKPYYDYTRAWELQTAESDLKFIEKQLRDAESNLRDFENKAHSKGIPPGWVRCQF
ncbi:hypothetical protein A45J_0374 [hot springs metagenome]|uniref:Uncharacterized protein n=1 Tax=hot springs metagenome TaxID=433727 RepID=A0A5J4L568_9ZZZZ